MESVKLEISLEEAVFVVNLLGNLPTSSNAHGLWAKLVEQVKPHLPKPEEPVKE